MSLYQTQCHETKTLTTSAITTLQVPTGQKLQSVALAFFTSAGALVTEAQIRAEIGNIRLAINGKDIVNASVVRLLDIYEMLSTRVGRPAGVPGMVELNLGRLLFVDPVARDFVGFGTSDVSSIQVQVTAGTLSAIASCQVITQRSPVNEPLGNYVRTINYAQSYNGTGVHTADTLPRDLDSSYLMIMANTGASGVITTGEVRVNGVTVTEQLPLGANILFNANKGFEQVTGYYMHIFTDGLVSSRLPMPGVTDLRVLTGFSTDPGAAGYDLTAMTLITPNAK
mgnify:CR=1 FL=1